MRKFSYFFGVILFLLILNSGMVLKGKALNFRIGVNENEEIIWKCKVCKEGEMEKIFGLEWDRSGIFKDMTRGKWLKWEVTETEVNDTHIRIDYLNWSWSINKDWSTLANHSTISYRSNPTDYKEGLNFTNHISLVPFWFPIPIGEYIGSLKLNMWYDVDNRVLPTINVNLPKDEISSNYPGKDIKIIAIYNDRGILESYKLYSKGNTVIVDISLDSLPPYVIPTLFGLFGVFLVAIITILVKRKRNLKLRIKKP